MTEPKITIDTFREAKFCLKGIRVKCVVLGLDPKETLRRLYTEGIPVSEVEHFDDAQIAKIIELARNRT